MYGHTKYLDEENKHGIKLSGISFNILTKYHQGYFNESTREDVLDGNLNIEIVRNTNIHDYEIFGKPHKLPYFENRNVHVSQLPKDIQDRMIELWADIENELTKTKPLFIDVGKK